MEYEHEPQVQRDTASAAAPAAALATPDLVPAHPVLGLQRKVGNLQVQRLLRTGAVRASLAIGPIDDEFEREADRQAELAGGACTCAGSGTSCDECSKHEEEMPQPLPRVVQREAVATDDVADAEPFVRNAIREEGSALSGPSLARMEDYFGRELDDVRIHTGTEAAHSAASLGALAYTVGPHIVFGEGQFNPSTRSGQHLLAHELTHVVQQTGPELRASRLQRDTPAGATDAPPPGPATPLPSRSLVDQKIPETGGDQIKFESVLLSTNVEFVRYQLEQMIIADGLKATASFVDRFAASPNSDQGTLAASEKTRKDLKEYGSGDVSGTPLPVATEDEIRHRMSNAERVGRVIPVVRREFNLLRTEANEFLDGFEQTARDKMFEALDGSQERVMREAQHYGLDPAALLINGPELRTAAFPAVKSPADVAQAGRTAQSEAARSQAAEKERQGLVKAAMELRARQGAINKLENELARVRTKTAKYPFPEVAAPLDVMKEMKVEEDIRKAKISFNEFLGKKQNEYPILAAYKKGETFDFSQIVDAKGPALKSALLAQVNEKLDNILKTREYMRAGRITPWEVPFVIDGTRRFLKIDNGTVRGKALDDRYAEKKQEKRDEKETWQAISTLSLALGLLALIPTPLSPALGAASAVLNVAVAAHDLSEYVVQSAASGTDFDKALAISQEDPSLFWIAVEVIGAAVDLGTAVKTLRAVSALKRAVVAGEEGAVRALEAEASKLGPKASERLLQEAEAARKAAIAEAKTAGATAHMVEEEAIKAGKLASDTFEHGGHTWQVLKDGRIVRCSKWCTDLQLLFGDVLKRHTQLEPAMDALRKLKGRAAGEAAAALGERMETIRRAEKMTLEELEKLLDKPEFAKGASALADDLRYVRYQRKGTGGLLSFADWEPLSKGGRLGGEQHQAIVKRILKDYPNGSVGEQAVTRGGKTNFADAFTPAAGGKKPIYHQVGDLNLKRGDPIARERRNMDAIRRAVGDDADILFHPKDGSAPMLNPDKNPAFKAFWTID